MKKYSIIHIPVLSFFSADMYRDAGLKWKGICFGYLFLLLAVCWIPGMVKVHVVFSNFIDNEAPAMVDQVPEITITDGQVSIEEPQPYFIKIPDSNEIIAIIDTTGKIQSLEDTNAFCLLKKNSLIMKQSEFETRTYDLSKVESFTLNSDSIMKFLHVMKKILVIISYPFALLGSYIFRIIQALIYAAIGLLFAAICKVSLKYDALLRLAVVAMTPCMILKTIFGLARVDIPLAFLLFFLVTLAYLFFGVRVCSQPPTTQEQIWNPQQSQM